MGITTLEFSNPKSSKMVIPPSAAVERGGGGADALLQNGDSPVWRWRGRVGHVRESLFFANKSSNVVILPHVAVERGGHTWESLFCHVLMPACADAADVSCCC